LKCVQFCFIILKRQDKEHPRSINRKKFKGIFMNKKDLVIGIPKEIYEGCRCVAVVPDMVKRLVKAGHKVIVQKDAGIKAFYKNEFYQEAGAVLIDEATEVYGQANVILKIRTPLVNEKLNKHELDLMNEGAAIISFLSPTLEPKIVQKLIDRKLTGFSMELIPRISRAQSMDALSSLSTVMGYRAVLLATNFLGKFFPLLMTAAGTIRPANVLVIGAGVAGLQAIAVSHRLGARVESFDTRPAVKEQVESLGARFIEMELPEDMETKYGYAKEASEEFIKKEMEAIGGRLPKTDVVISTALVYGRKAPLLITEDMVKMMSPGSVIIDLAAEQGGNCALTKLGETVQKYDVTIHGPKDLPSQLPLHTSLMYSQNVINTFNNLYQAEDDTIDLEDEINANALATYKGEIVSELVKNSFNKSGEK
jgi:NAD(P) transhydrogenase subunit alpha